MNITDLSDTNVSFSCEFSGDGVDYFDYTFTASIHGEPEYSTELNSIEIEQLRENCKKILEATSYFEGGH